MPVAVFITTIPWPISASCFSDLIWFDLIWFDCQEKTDLLIGQVLAYGALLKSGRGLSDEELLTLVNHFISGAKIKSYVQPIAFQFLIEMLLTVCGFV